MTMRYKKQIHKSRSEQENQVQLNNYVLQINAWELKVVLALSWARQEQPLVLVEKEK